MQVTQHTNPPEKFMGRSTYPNIPPPTLTYPPQNERRGLKKQAGLIFSGFPTMGFLYKPPLTSYDLLCFRGWGIRDLLRPGCLGCLIYWFPALLGTSKPAEGDPGWECCGVFSGDGGAYLNGRKCIGVLPRVRFTPYRPYFLYNFLLFHWLGVLEGWFNA